jgi:hypothetical protein
MTMNDALVLLAAKAANALPPEAAEDRANRTLLKLVRLAHAMSEQERELALVLLQAIAAWDGVSEAA